MQLSLMDKGIENPTQQLGQHRTEIQAPLQGASTPSQVVMLPVNKGISLRKKLETNEINEATD